MTKLRVIGDVHGKFSRYREIIRDVPFSIQVGDMGVGFINHGGIPSANPPFDAMSQGRHLFLRGNHDSPSACRKHRYWITDGSMVDGKIFCLGGAVSIDRAYRTQGLDWWPDEECSYEELQRHIDTYATVKPDVVISHECPESVADEIMARHNMQKIADGSRTRQALQAMLEIHQPRQWYFGHWHRSQSFCVGSTYFCCLAELEYVDIEV